VVKIQNFDSLGLCSHISAPINVKFGIGERTLNVCSYVPNFTFIGATCRPYNLFLDSLTHSLVACR